MKEKDFEEAIRSVRTSGLQSLDGFSLGENDLLRVSRPIGENTWTEYSVSFGELCRAVRRELPGRRPA